MQKQRDVHGWTEKQTAEAYHCSPAHISRIEHGNMPSRSLVIFYDETFGAEGLLLSLYEAAIEAPEQERRRAYGQKRVVRAIPGDASSVVCEPVYNGVIKQPGEVFTVEWTIENSGSVPWEGRRIERVGPKTGPGLITSPATASLPDTLPGKKVKISMPLKAPTFDCSSIAYFKMIDSAGRLCFPENYMLGLEVIVTVRDQLPDKPLASEQDRAY